jgi:putative signal transducing protein
MGIRIPPVGRVYASAHRTVSRRTGRRVWEDAAVSGGLVLVYTTNQIFEGHLTKARLEDEGIPVVLKGEGDGPYRIGPVHLFVPEGMEVQARVLIEAIARGDYAVDSAEEESER